MSRTGEGFDWTVAAIAQLQNLWSEGHSTAEIGRRMGVTKNAVVGKARRLGLPGRPSPIRASDPSGPEPKRPPRPMPVPKLASLACLSVPPPTPPDPEPRAAPVVQRTPSVAGDKPCCWPIGNPGTPGFRFCDAPALTGKPYCSGHADLAYVKSREHRPAERSEQRPTQ